MCVGMKGFGLSKVSWLYWVRLHNTRVPSPSHVLVLLLGYCQSARAEWVAWNPSWQKSLQPVFGMAFSDGLIWISFSNCPRRCCFSLAHAAQASMARFYFHDISFLCRKSTAHKLPSQPLCKRTHKHRSAREQRKHVCKRENSMIKHTCPAKSILSILGESQNSWWQLILNGSVCSHLYFPLWFFSWSSLRLSLRQHHYFSQQEGPCAAKYCDVLQKGKGASPSASKTLVRPKYNPCFIIFEKQICVCLLCYVPLAKLRNVAFAVVVRCQINKESQSRVFFLLQYLSFQSTFLPFLYSLFYLIVAQL